jgi:N utilization substance protein A
MKSDFIIAIAQLSAEKNLDSKTVFEAVEAAMASALKKDDLQYADIEVHIDPQDGDISALRRYLVMADDDIEDDEIQVSPERAAKLGFPNAKLGDYVTEPLEDSAQAGRIAAQTAKQVVLQRLREAERDVVFEEFTSKEGELVSGTVLRVEPGRRQVIIDLGRSEAVLPSSEQVRPEHYRVGQRLRVFVKEVYRASKGPQVVVSRSHPDLLRRIFELEVPEVARGLIEIVAIAREPGYRSKVAVVSRQHGIDPIGACVGMRGARIQNIVNELGGERIDLIRWDPNPTRFVVNALSPAEVSSIRIDEETNTAFVAVPDKQLSLAIGKEGQNARLAAKLTKRRIDIQAESVLIHSGQDLYPPPEANMEAIPLATRPGLPTLPTIPHEAPPSQAAYARPGLPGEFPAAAVATPVAPPEAAPLSPEMEAIAAFQEEPTTVATAPEAPAPVAPTRRDTGDRSGLRFGDEIGERRELEEEGAGRPGAPARRRRGGPATPERARPADAGRRNRRFEVDEEEIEEGLQELHGEEFDFDFDDDEE